MSPGWLEPSRVINRRICTEQEGHTFLQFSTGKDSLGAWCALKEAGFTHIYPIFMYHIPGLRLQEESLAYYERVLGVPRIYRMPHPAFYDKLEAGMYMPRAARRAVAAMNLVTGFTMDAMRTWIQEDYGLPNVRAAVGLRATDNPLRATAVQRHGPVRADRWWAIFDWTVADVLAALKRHGLKLPPDYRLFRNSFDGPRYAYLVQLMKHYPDDIRRIERFFPYVRCEIMRMRFRERHFPPPPPETPA